MVCLGVSIVVCVSLLENVRVSGCRSGVLIVGVMAAGVALGIGFGVVLNLHFLRKRWFLSVILPDPLTLIRYWHLGRAVMTFPVESVLYLPEVVDIRFCERTFMRESLVDDTYELCVEIVTSA